MGTAITRDPFLAKVRAQPILEKYSLQRKLGRGGFASVYLAVDAKTQQQVALKLEHESIVPSVLNEEYAVLRELKDTIGIPETYGHGRHGDYRILAFELLGPSLEDLFVFCERSFSIKTITMLAIQLLSRLEAIHSKGILHQDVKPRNCLTGSGLQGNIIYIADFGLADHFRPGSEEGEEDHTGRSRLLGTARFASLRAHRGQTLSFGDDLESMCYMLAYFHNGRLPWQSLKAENDTELARLIRCKKENTKPQELFQPSYKRFTDCLAYARGLPFGEVPDYKFWSAEFRRVGPECRIEFDNVWDWIEKWYNLQEGGSDAENVSSRRSRKRKRA